MEKGKLSERALTNQIHFRGANPRKNTSLEKLFNTLQVFLKVAKIS